MDAGLGDDAKRDLLYRFAAQRESSDPGEDLCSEQAGNRIVGYHQPKTRSVVFSSRRATGTRSASYESSSAGSALPSATSASFQARLYASCNPVFMPCAPTGLG